MGWRTQDTLAEVVVPVGTGHHAFLQSARALRIILFKTMLALCNNRSYHCNLRLYQLAALAAGALVKCASVVRVAFKALVSVVQDGLDKTQCALEKVRFL